MLLSSFNERINFPPQKSARRHSSILSLNNNISNIKLKDKKRSLKRFKRKKDEKEKEIYVWLSNIWLQTIKPA